MGTIYKNSIPYSGGESVEVDQTYDATSTNAQSGKAVAEVLAGVEVKVWQTTFLLSGNETRQLELPNGVFALNLIFSNNNGFCDTYTHFGIGFGARHLKLYNSGADAGCYIYLSATGELRTNTSAANVQLQMQALYLEK